MCSDFPVSKQYLDLISLRSSSSWTFQQSSTIRLPGAHGEEIIRSLYIDQLSQAIFTAGEDGLIKAWRIPETNPAQLQDKDGTEILQKRKDRANICDGKGRFKPY